MQPGDSPGKVPTQLFSTGFVLLIQGQLVSQLGTQLFVVAAIFWIKERTGSASLVGLLGAAGAVPALVLGPVAGVFADRWPRLRSVIWCDVLRGVVLLPLVTFTLFVPEEGGLALGALFAAVILSSAFTSLFEPALAAMIPDLVPDEKLDRANALSMGLARMTRLGGPAVGALAFRFFGAPALFLFNLLSYLLSAFSESFIRLTEPERRALRGGASGSMRSELVEGFRHIWEHRELRMLLLTAGAMNFALTPILTLLPFYVEDTLGASVDWYGFLMAAVGVGSLAGFALSALVALAPERRVRGMTFAMMALAAACSCLAFVRTTALSCGIAFLAGVGAGFFNVNNQTLLQSSSPGPLRGRILSAAGTLTRGLSPLAMTAAGFAADLTDRNVPLVYGICGAGLLLISIGAHVGVVSGSGKAKNRKEEESS